MIPNIYKAQNSLSQTNVEDDFDYCNDFDDDYDDEYDDEFANGYYADYYDDDSGSSSYQRSPWSGVSADNPRNQPRTNRNNPVINTKLTRRDFAVPPEDMYCQQQLDWILYYKTTQKYHPDLEHKLLQKIQNNYWQKKKQQPNNTTLKPVALSKQKRYFRDKCKKYQLVNFQGTSFLGYRNGDIIPTFQFRKDILVKIHSQSHGKSTQMFAVLKICGFRWHNMHILINEAINKCQQCFRADKIRRNTIKTIPLKQINPLALCPREFFYIKFVAVEADLQKVSKSSHMIFVMQVFSRFAWAEFCAAKSPEIVVSLLRKIFFNYFRPQNILIPQGLKDFISSTAFLQFFPNFESIQFWQEDPAEDSLTRDVVENLSQKLQFLLRQQVEKVPEMSRTDFIDHHKRFLRNYNQVEKHILFNETHQTLQKLNLSIDANVNIIEGMRKAYQDIKFRSGFREGELCVVNCNSKVQEKANGLYLIHNPFPSRPENLGDEYLMPVRLVKAEKEKLRVELLCDFVLNLGFQQQWRGNERYAVTIMEKGFQVNVSPSIVKKAQNKGEEELVEAYYAKYLTHYQTLPRTYNRQKQQVAGKYDPQGRLLQAEYDKTLASTSYSTLWTRVAGNVTQDYQSLLERKREKYQRQIREEQKNKNPVIANFRASARKNLFTTD